ncbi:MAG: P-II family nitrogen regulator [Dehalococcoidia bacterium]|nr:P-II family nitrogen regulator [Dehalococcoidia bacterium]
MKKIEAIIRPERVNTVKDALVDAGFSGLNTAPVTGRGAQRGVVHTGRSGQAIVIDMLPKTKLEVVVSDSDVERAVDVIVESARTGDIGDGKIFIQPVEQVVRVRTGERGDSAI